MLYRRQMYVSVMTENVRLIFSNHTEGAALYVHTKQHETRP